MLNTNEAQYKLSDSGDILYQKLLNSPLPGEPVAKLVKGETALTPDLEILTDATDAKDFLSGWLTKYIAETLAPLHALKAEDKDLTEPAKNICDKLYDTLGVIHREQLEDSIKELDNDTRAPLRARKIKMGPLLVFLPELNKPAAVRLKALLWSLYNDKALPPPTPKDGVVSFGIDPDAVDRQFHQVIGYPVFAGRAIRIDMLDRVVNNVYDTAAEGKFQAKHQMAEWLGCSIEDLYAILRSMGHKQIPAATPEETPTEEQSTKKTDEKSEDQKPEEKKPDIKPDLAWFWIKKGRASEKPVKKKPAATKSFKTDKPKKKKGDRKQKTPKTYEFKAEAKPEDNPFAVLQQLKK